MIACPTCGTANPERARFCPECGTPLGLTADPPAPREVRKTVTVLFADMAGSTTLGEQLDPETMRALLGRYFAVMKRIIELHGGMVEKFIGDAVMAVFGIPVVHEDDALRAVRAAADIRTELAALDAELTLGRGIAVRFRTGIATGEVVAGDPGAGGTLATGDAVNTAARLEQAAAPGEILLGRMTWQLVRDAVEVETVEPIEARGKAERVPAYRLLTVEPGVAGHARRFDAELVGRERELAALHNAFERVASERSCQLFTLLGSAGVGKSRLVAEFAAAVAHHATVLRGRCLSYGEGITYWPIGEIIRSAAGIEDVQTPETARARLRALLDGERDPEVLGTLIASAVGLSHDPVAQEEVFWAIRKVLEHLAREGPLVVVIEDIHWAESTLLDLIEHIADWSRDAPILLLGLGRPEVLDSRAGWGGGKLNATTILLEPLGADATTRLIAALPGGSALPEDIEARVLAAAEGNPLFVEELLGMLVDDGRLRQALDGTWVAADTLAQVRIPASISALIAARLERLAPDERAVAQRASVIGRVFEQAAVIELASAALRPAVDRSLLALMRKELIRPERSDLAAGGAFKFRHILIRDAAYEALPKADRAILHERFADWRERTAGERLAEYEEIVGYHLEAAHRYRIELGESGDRVTALAGRAGGHLAAAGGRAFERGDMAAAKLLLTRAAAAFPVGSPDRLRLLPDLSFAVLSTGSMSDADGLLEDAVDEATKAGQSQLGLHAELEREMVRVMSAGIHAEPRATAEAAIAGLEREGDDLGLARAYLVVASASWNNGRVAEALAARSRALEHAAAAGDLRTERRVTFWGPECYGPAPAVAAIVRLEEAITAGSWASLSRAQAQWSLSGLYAMRDRADDARRSFRELRATLQELGQTGSSEIGAITELVIGDWVRADEIIEEGVDELEGLGATSYQATLMALRSISLARQGSFAIAIGSADRAVLEGSSEDALVHLFANTGRSIAAAGLGDVVGAIEAGDAAVRLAEKTDWLSFHADALLVLATALRAAGVEHDAASAASRARELYRVKENLVGEQRVARFLE